MADKPVGQEPAHDEYFHDEDEVIGSTRVFFPPYKRPSRCWHLLTTLQLSRPGRLTSQGATPAGDAFVCKASRCYTLFYLSPGAPSCSLDTTRV